MEETSVNKHTHNCVHCDFTKECEDIPCEVPIQVVCENTECILKDKLAAYQWKLKAAEGSIDKLKLELDAFRLMCLSPATMEEGSNTGKYSYFTNKSWLSARKALWEEKTSIETQLIFLDLFQNAAHAVAEIVSKQKTKVQIKKNVLQRSHDESVKATAIRDKVQEPKVAKQALTQYERIIVANMK